MRRSILLLATLVLGCPVWAAPVAVLTDYSGPVKVTRGGANVVIKKGLPLEAGDKVLAGGGKAVLFYLGSAPKTIKGNTSLTVAAAGGASQSNTWGRVYTGLSRGLAGQRRSVPAAMRPRNVVPVYPANTAILDQRPTFQWDAAGLNAAAYDISVTKSGGVSVWRATVTDTKVPYPATAPSLSDAVSWQVIPLVRNAAGTLLPQDGAESPEVTFRIATSEEASQLKAELTQVDNAVADDPATRALARAAVLRERGFVGQALQELNGVNTEFAVQLKELWTAQSEDQVLGAIVPDVTVDASTVAPDARKKFVDATHRFGLEIPSGWGYMLFDLSKIPLGGEPRQVQVLQFSAQVETFPCLTVAVEQAPKADRPLLPALQNMFSTTGELQAGTGTPTTLHDHPAVQTDWSLKTPKGTQEVRSLEFEADGRRWVISAVHTERNAPEFSAIEALLSTWRLTEAGETPPENPTFEVLLQEMKEKVLPVGDEINGFREQRDNAAPTPDFGTAEAALKAAPPNSLEAALKARIAAATAGNLLWEAVKKGDVAAAKNWIARRQALLQLSYENEKAHHLRQLEITDRRIAELAAVTPPMYQAASNQMVLEAWLNAQTFRTEELQTLAGDFADLNTQEQMARLTFAYKLRLQRMAAFNAVPDEEMVNRRLGVIRALSDIGSVEENRASYDAARRYYLKVLDLRRALPAPPVKREEDTPLRDLAYLEYKIGNTLKARTYYEQSLEAMNARREGRERQIEEQTDARLKALMTSELWQGYSVLYNNLALVAHGVGDYEKSRQYHEQALTAARKMPVDERNKHYHDLTVARSTANYATLVADSGQYDDALNLYKQALDLYRGVNSAEDMAFTLVNVAGLLRAQDKVAEARNYAETARSLFASMPQSRESMAVDLLLAYLERKDGNLQQVEELASRVLATARALGDQEFIASGGRVLIRARLASLGENPATPTQLESLWAPLREIEAADRRAGANFSIMRTLETRALIQEKAGDFPGAVKSLGEAIDRLESIRATVKSANSFAEQQENYQMYEQMVRMLLKLNRTDEAFDYLQRARSKKLQDNLRLTSLKSPNPAVQQLLDRAAALEGRLQTVRAQLSEEQAKPPVEQDITKVESLQSLVASTQAEFFQVSNQLKEKYPAYEKVVAIKPKLLKRAQPDLPPGALLLQYAPLGDKLYVFAVTKEALKIYTLPANPATVKARIRELRRQIDSAVTDATGGKTPDLATDTVTRKALTDLYEMLITPVAADLKQADTVAIIPTQELFYLPFHALARADAAAPNGLRFLVEEKPIAYLAAADVLSVVQQRDETELGQGLLALGDPAGNGLQPSLPEAREEVTAIARLYPTGQALVGEQATKSVLFQPESQKRRALHLAAHGVLDPIRTDRSFIQLAPSEKDDGKLRVGEIYGLDLSAVDLVTLSACRTALGEGDPDGSEITSLADSFSSAGTPTVVASLWSVEDESTRRLMETFYKEWSGGKSKASALRAAQLTLLQDSKTRHPFYWAAFEVLGDWR